MARSLTVTNANGKYVGSRAMLKGEDARVVAKRLLREKVPEGESFNRRLDYPMRGWRDSQVAVGSFDPAHSPDHVGGGRNRASVRTLPTSS